MDRLSYVIGPLAYAAGMVVCMRVMSKGLHHRSRGAENIQGRGRRRLAGRDRQAARQTTRAGR